MPVRLLLLAVIALVMSVIGCVIETPPQLIQVLDFAPREAEVGDRLELSGVGFPQGRPARLAFRGTLYRPGEKPTTGVEILAQGVVTSSQQIDLALSETLEALFC